MVGSEAAGSRVVGSEAPGSRVVDSEAPASPAAVWRSEALAQAAAFSMLLESEQASAGVAMAGEAIELDGAADGGPVGVAVAGTAAGQAIESDGAAAGAVGVAVGVGPLRPRPASPPLAPTIIMVGIIMAAAISAWPGTALAG